MRIRMSYIIPVYFFSCVFHSCSSRQEEKNVVYQSFDKELENMRRVVSISSDELLAELDNKRSDLTTRSKAEVWYPKAVMIRKLTDTTIGYIKTLRGELQTDNKNVLADISPINRQKLYERLLQYKNDVLKVDNLLAQEFKKSLVLFPATQNDIQITEEEITDLFKGVSIQEALLLLRHMENNVRFIENRTINFCLEQVGSTDGISFYDQISTIIGQSGSVVKKGETVEITAGIGSFSKAASPKISIDGKLVQLSEDGAARHKIYPNTTPGQKTVNIRIEYTDQEGIKRLVEKTVKYQVVE